MTAHQKRDSGGEPDKLRDGNSAGNSGTIAPQLKSSATTPKTPASICGESVKARNR
jgi:hypothetical protein